LALDVDPDPQQKLAPEKNPAKPLDSRFAFDASERTWSEPRVGWPDVTMGGFGIPTSMTLRKISEW